MCFEGVGKWTGWGDVVGICESGRPLMSVLVSDWVGK